MRRLTWTACTALAALMLAPNALVAQTEPEQASSAGEEATEAIEATTLEVEPEQAEVLDEDEVETGDEGEQENRFFMTHHLQLRAGPIGLSLTSDFGYRVWLTDSQHMLLQDTRIDMGVATRINPSLFWGGAFIEALPLTILKLRAEIQEAIYFGTFGFIHNYGSIDADWSPDTLDRIEDEGLGESATGQRLYLSGTLQLKVGPVVALYENNYTWYWMNMDGPYYEPLEVFLLEPDDAVWGMVSSLGYLIAPNPSVWYLVLGARHNRHVTREGDFRTQRVGLMVLWKIPSTWWAWGNPQVATIFQFYVEDEYREGDPYWAFQLTLSF